MLIVDEDECTGCRACERGCPFEAITIVDGIATINERCILCGICVNLCPVHAISIEREEVETDLSGWKGIMVWCELDADMEPREVVLELLGKARSLSHTTGDEVIVALPGPRGIERLGEGLIAQGADRVICLEHDLLKGYTTDAFANVLVAIIAEERPSVVLMGATINGRDLAPRLAARLGTGLTADCTDLTIDDEERLLQTRPAFGGNIMASIITPRTRPQMATVRPRVFRSPPPEESREGVVEKRGTTLRRSQVRTRVVDLIPDDQQEMRVEEARILVSVGRGVAKRDNLEIIKELAELLDATVSSSRSLVEMGWMPRSTQVGQSGKTVSPRIYIALGISGAVQHTVGMSSSDIILAINRDPEAPIFKVADLGIVGDVEEIVPALIRRLKMEGDQPPMTESSM